MTVDIVPLLPGEAPEQGIARIYDGGATIVIDPDSNEGWVEETNCRDVEILEVPDGAFDEWRDVVLRRLHAVHDWQSEDVRGHPVLWSAGCGWQVELSSIDITLRHRRSVDPDAPSLDDAGLLAVFEGLRTILHRPDHFGSWCDLDDPDDRPAIIG